MGMDEGAVWGECQGSGKNPYQVQVDLSGPAFKCSCPSRKFPCKHGLGLMLMYAAGLAEMKHGARPAFVNEWMSGRAQRAEKKAAAAERPAEPVSPEVAAEKRSGKVAKINASLGELDTWVLDLVRTGTSSAPSRGFAFFDTMARRMVDAQAPGAARLVRELASVASRGAGWQVPFLEKLASLYLLVRAASRFESLPEPVQMDVIQALGVPVSTDQLAPLPGVRDRWSIVAQQTELEDRLRVRRTWLVGATCGRIAMILHFAHAAAAMDTSLVMGTAFEGEVVFYPGNSNRAVVRSREDAVYPVAELRGHASIASALEAVSGHIAQQPWTNEMVVVLSSVVPMRSGDGWYVIDGEGAGLSIGKSSRANHVAAAVSGGRPIDVIGLLDHDTLQLLSLHTGSELLNVAINPTVEAEAR